MLKWIAGALVLLLVVGGAYLYAGAMGFLGQQETAGVPHESPRPEPVVAGESARQSAAARSLGGSSASQILFGDFHVHTTFSFDSFLINLPMAGGAGARPPADACDFARFCSALDFWSINDHAENLTPHLWRETVESVRQCNAAAGDPSNPDLVTYLGWEWSQIGSRPDNHYGHKNVVVLGTGDEEIPARPISARSPAIDTQARAPLALGQRLALTLINGQRGRDFTHLLRRMTTTPRCPDDVPVRELPADCMEGVATPEELFAKLDEWALPSLVIPHGTTWGMYTPVGSDWRKQLPGHDPARQSLVEIYSGHGNSEQLPTWREVLVAADGSLSCPEPRAGYLPSCWRAGELIGERCREDGVEPAECERRVVAARQNHIDAFQAGWKTLPGHAPNDWLDAGQAPDMFQPAFNYRPRGSVQYMLALRDFSDPAAPKRFDFGFLGSSDNHMASPGTGYKEFARGEMTEGRGSRGEPVGGGGLFGGTTSGEPVAESVPFVSSGESPLQLFEIERASAYFVTGGLVAVHSAGRDRQAIWDALERKEVYATSGRRTLLWFDLLGEAGPVPMGSTVERRALPRFRVRAAGSLEQQPGCPDHAVAALGPERIEAICRGECHHPGETRRPITRIEVVRIRPQIRADEPLEDLVEDPWKTLPCPADGSGCVVEFSDPEFETAGRDSVYYARAIEAPDELIHGSDPLRCSRDTEGRCLEIDPCGMNTPQADDCLSEAEPRAWSSPIYVDFAS